MTIVRGVHILAAPCCGASYAFPRYVSMNFSAFAYWTDGWREHSPMPNDEGLRRCNCGQFVLVKDMVAVATEETVDFPHMDHLPDKLLPECIAKASNEEMEVGARLGYRRYLNHEYRERYRQHRDAEEAATETAWISANPDRRTWWDKLLRRKPPEYSRSPNSPFTFPPYEPSADQLQNMKRLSDILRDWSEGSPKGYIIELAELYREQGRFDEAETAIRSLDTDQVGVTEKLISNLIKEGHSAPIRYRM